MAVDLPAVDVATPPNGAWCQPIEYGNGRRNSPSYLPSSSTSTAPSESRAIGVEVRQARRRPLGDHEGLERPGRPERHDHEPLVVLDDDARAAGLLGDVVEQQPPPGPAEVAGLGLASSRTASTGSAVPAQTWPWGCGFEAPIAAPRFSKTWTQRKSGAELGRSGRPTRRRPSHVRSATSRRGSGRGGARSTRRGRHHARLRHGAGRAPGRLGRVRPERREVVVEDERGVVVRVPMPVRPGVARAQVAVGDVVGRSCTTSGSSAPSQGRRVRPAETSTHSSISGLYRRCGSPPSPPGSDTVGHRSDGTIDAALHRSDRIHDHELPDLGAERLGRVRVDARRR